ncbi:MAG: SAM-dependent methyltransferase [Anaerolineaceae bacterium]
MADLTGPALVLAGFGSSSPLQLTVEAQQMAVFIGQALSLGLPERLRTLLARQGVELTELDHLLTDRSFAEGYAAIGQAVLARAQKDPPAMFISQGSPLFANAITRYLAAEANRLQLAVRIFPGVSVLDVVVAEIGIDVGRAGLQTITAGGLVARPVALNPRMPLLLLEIAGLAADGGSAEAYGPLVALLLESYPGSQPVTLINTTGNGSISHLTATLETFGELLPNIDTSSCLFIDIRRRAPTVETA